MLNSVPVYADADTQETDDEEYYGEGCILDDEEWINSLPVADYSYVRNDSNDNVTGGNRDTLPSSVDLSTDLVYGQYFPPIGNQHGTGSCVCFATTQYNKFKNTMATLSNTFCPQWNYSLLSKGILVHGTTFYENYSIMEQLGALRYSDYPTGFFDNFSSDPTAWNYNFTNYLSNNTTAHYNSLGLRVSVSTVRVYCTPINNIDPYNKTFLTFGTNTDSDHAIDSIKSALNEHHVLTVSVYISSDQIITGYNTTEKVISIAKRLSPDSSTHAMTIVGYDDNFTADINGDGEIYNWETGALKLANSWGDGWQNNGYIWVMYDALNGISAGFSTATNNINPDNRVPFFANFSHESGTVYHPLYKIDVTEDPVYLVGKLNIDTDYRYRYEYFYGKESLLPYPHHASSRKLPYACSNDSTLNVPFDGSLVIDLFKDYDNYAMYYDNCLPYKYIYSLPFYTYIIPYFFYIVNKKRI